MADVSEELPLSGVFVELEGEPTLAVPEEGLGELQQGNLIWSLMTRERSAPSTDGIAKSGVLS